jgi:hypothetical protein
LTMWGMCSKLLRYIKSRDQRAIHPISRLAGLSNEELDKEV